jgi:hypothetical protein
VRLRALALALAVVWLAAPSTGTAARVYRVGMLWYGRSLETRQPVIDAFKQGLGTLNLKTARTLGLTFPRRSCSAPTPSSSDGRLVR